MSREHKYRKWASNQQIGELPELIIRARDDYNRAHWGKDMFSNYLFTRGDDEYFFTKQSFENGKNYIVNIETLSQLFMLFQKENQETKRQLDHLTEQINLCNRYIITLKPKISLKKILEKLSPVMVKLIDIGKKNEIIEKITYDVDNEEGIVFNLLLKNINAESYRLSSEIELELSEKYEDVDIVVNPVDINDIELDEKYQVYTKS